MHILTKILHLHILPLSVETEDLQGQHRLEILCQHNILRRGEQSLES